MKRVGCLLVITGIFILFLADVSPAQYISTRSTFWGTLQYTKNGVEFKEFGKGWSNLLTETETAEEAHENIADSRNLHYAGAVLGVAGGAILGYASFLESRNEDVDDGYWVMGGSTVLVSLIFELVSRHKLEKGLLAYNRRLGGRDPAEGEAGKFDIGFSGNAICLSYNF